MDVITSRVEYRSSVFIKTVFEATFYFGFSNILSITQATLNQIDNIKSFTGDMRFDVVGLTCRMKSVIAATTKPLLRSKYNELPTFLALTHLHTNPRLRLKPAKVFLTVTFSI